ncbi:MAG: hypothetical protein K1X75_06110 [Leptospirales bacterium]|nr:hypothetical protein [Leptospirales bacterium]
MAIRLGLCLVVIVGLESSGCLAIESPDIEGSVTGTLLWQQLAIEAYWNRGSCVIRVDHESLAGTSIYFCTGMTRQYCDGSAIWTAAEMAGLNESFTSVANQYLFCAGDAANESAFISSLTAPNFPLFARMGASRSAYTANINFATVTDCSIAGFAAGPQGNLLSNNELRLFQTGALWLKRFAANSSCRQGIALSSAEAGIDSALTSAKRQLFQACDAGANDDPALENCSPMTPAVFGQ